MKNVKVRPIVNLGIKAPTLTSCCGLMYEERSSEAMSKSIKFFTKTGGSASFCILSCTSYILHFKKYCS